ncbi:MAG: hypothetical protein GVY13_05735 [Alphaproteobacteria bacterium]|jgi:hypothetical protein|nr:hypothetical protein [Alphaproteobacteria bacterium]
MSDLINFVDFSDSRDLSLNGRSKTLGTSDGQVLRLAEAVDVADRQAGSVFYKTPVNVDEFETSFAFRITDPRKAMSSEAGADGLVFVVQALAPDALGLGDAEIGYGGISQSVGIEFDIFKNSYDPDNNHIGINHDGSMRHDLGLIGAVEPVFENGEITYAWIDYDDGVLAVRVSQTPDKPSDPVLATAIDILDLIGNGPAIDEAFVGFTSGAFGASANHDLLEWSYRTGAALAEERLSIQAVSLDAEEGDGGTTPLTFTIVRSGDNQGFTSVDWTVSGSGADPVDGQDFGGSLPRGVANFFAGETSKTITVDIAGDTDAEPDESFTISLSNVGGGVTVSDGTANGTIRNDDAAPPAPPPAPPGGGTLLGPSPYLSFADSPFASIEGFSYFHLEDFVDGALNTPGVSVSPKSGVVVGRNRNNDSVDFDDGVIDGNGNNGYSLWTNFRTNTLTFNFQDQELSGFPTHVGLVWTDVGTPLVGNVVFEAFDHEGILIESIGPTTVGDGKRTGETAEDRFFGAIHEDGISALTLRMTDSDDWELDHLQYGHLDTVASSQTLSIEAAESNVDEGQQGATPFTFSVTRSDGAGTASVDWAVSGSGGDPADAEDFGGSLPRGTATFALGETSRTIAVDVVGDNDVEADEGFTVTLSNAGSGASIGDATAGGTIRNDDVAPTPPPISPPAGSGSVFGPSEYLSFADSPFAAIEGFTYFHLEDFEDRALNTPGVTVSPIDISTLSTSSSDSVDGDDGAIDGSGNGGRALFSGFDTKFFTFTFDSGALGGLPTHAGLAWTDVNGPAVDEVIVEIFGPDGSLVESIGPATVGDGTFTGNTAEDRFFGAIHEAGISALTMRMVQSNNWELDHLQYGRLDAAPRDTVSIEAAAADRDEGNGGSTPFTFTVTRGGDAEGLFTVDYAVSPDGANPAGAADFVAGSVETVTTTRQTTIPSTGQVMEISLTLPEGTTASSVTAQGLVNRGDVPEPPISIAYVIDVSGSTFDEQFDPEFLGDVPVGDLNGDGDANEVLDAEIAAFEALNEQIAGIEFGIGVNVGVIAFAGGAEVVSVNTPVDDVNGNGLPDINDVLRSTVPGNNFITMGGVSIDRIEGDDNGTDFDDALKKVVEFFEAQPVGDNFLFFLSDGENNGTDSFEDEVETLINPAGLDARIRAIGVGANADIDELDRVDDGIRNGSAEVVLDPDDLTPQLTRSPVEPAEIDRVELLRDGLVVATIDGDDLIQTPLGLRYEAEIGGLDPDRENDIEVRVVADDPARTSVATSQTVEPTDAAERLPAGTLTFTAGETSRTLAIDVTGDRELEPDEGFAVTLSNPSGGLGLGTATAAGTIRNDDTETVEPPPPVAAADLEVFRFFNTDSGAHFYTNSPAERDAVARALPQFRYEGPSFQAIAETDPAADEVFRFFNTETGVHFYTIAEAERDAVIANLPQFQFEGVAYHAYEDARPGAEELYRFFNTMTGTHFYTPDEVERDAVIASLPQFQYEGIGYYVDALVP